MLWICAVKLDVSTEFHISPVLLLIRIRIRGRWIEFHSASSNAHINPFWLRHHFLWTLDKRWTHTQHTEMVPTIFITIDFSFRSILSATSSPSVEEKFIENLQNYTASLNKFWDIFHFGPAAGVEEMFWRLGVLCASLCGRWMCAHENIRSEIPALLFALWSAHTFCDFWLSDVFCWRRQRNILPF